MRDLMALTPVTQPLLSTRALCFEAGGERLVDQLTLNIPLGSKLVLLGANGAGKSLTLRLLHGLIQPTSGEIFWEGEPIGTDARHAQALVFQRPVMLRRSVRANLRFALSAKGVRGAERRQREEEALNTARLEPLADRPARLLSGGEQQRLAVARALACRPRLLFLDEPTASLDPASTQAVEDLIQTAHRDGVTIVLVTHDAGQARRLGEEIAFMHDGRIVEFGPATQVLDQPQSGPAAAWRSGQLYLAPKGSST
ncbi:MAG: phosphate ABC transporter ATP-binding protein [Pseudomonadota bacterium]